MTQEEKAKRYDEVFNAAKEWYNNPNSSNIGKSYLYAVFPELKESEDEKIRKELIGFLRNIPNSNYTCEEMALWLEKQGEQGNNEDEAILHRFSFYSYKDEPNILYLAGLYVNDEYRNKGIGTKILKIADEVAVSMKCSSILLKTEIGSNAERLYKNNGYSVFRREENQVWLEKQSEQKQETNYPKFDLDDILAIQCCMEAAKKVTEDKELYEELKSLHSRLLDAYWIGKQGEQKPQGKTALEAINEEKVDNADKVEQKPAWSKKDKKVLDELINFFVNMELPADHDFRVYASWLKSLKDRYTWKPSEEQMDALETATSTLQYTSLESLYNELKKL